METKSVYEPEQVSAVVDPVQESLMEMSHPELTFMQEITLHQMSEAAADTRVLLGRVWYRLEQERRRRKADIDALERMYFAR